MFSRLKTRCRDWILNAQDLLNLRSQVAQRGRQLYRILREELHRGLGLYRRRDCLPAACFAAGLARIPFYVYLFDDYVHQWVDPVKRSFARFARTWLQHAAGIIVPNEFLARDYAREYKVTSTIIRNAVELPRRHPAATHSPAGRDRKLHVLYAGTDTGES